MGLRRSQELAMTVSIQIRIRDLRGRIAPEVYKSFFATSKK